MPSPNSNPVRPLRRGLYAITNGPRDDLPVAAGAALGGGAAMLQYRDKTRDVARRLREARTLADLCAQYGVPLIINDDMELARASGASGVHLGEDDPTIAEARAALGNAAIIGVSCYDSLDRARDAAAAGADYLAFGAFFPSTTKPEAYAGPSAKTRPSMAGLSTGPRHATPDLLRGAREFGLPRVAIGGITVDNGGSLIDAGADFLAVISAVFGANDVLAAARRFATLFTTDGHG